MRINVDPRGTAAPAPSIVGPVEPPERFRGGRESSVQTVEKTLAILEVVAERGTASAREVSDALGYPLPTVYRLLQALVQADYLRHVRASRHFELGTKVGALADLLGRPSTESRSSTAHTTPDDCRSLDAGFG